MFYHNTGTLFHFCIMYGYFYGTEEDVSNCGTVYMAHKAKNAYYFAISRKTFLTPDCEDFNFDKILLSSVT